MGLCLVFKKFTPRIFCAPSYVIFQLYIVHILMKLSSLQAGAIFFGLEYFYMYCCFSLLVFFFCNLKIFWFAATVFGWIGSTRSTCRESFAIS